MDVLSPRLVAVLTGPDGERRTLVFDRARIVVGRAPDCDVVVPGSGAVARKHCAIELEGAKVMVRDLGTTGGTWLVSRQWVRTATPLELVPGDAVILDAYRLEVTASST